MQRRVTELFTDLIFNCAVLRPVLISDSGEICRSSVLFFGARMSKLFCEFSWNNIL